MDVLGNLFRIPTFSNSSGIDASAAVTGVIVNDGVTGVRIYPRDNWWNADISSAPVDAQSSTIIGWLMTQSSAGNPAGCLWPDMTPPLGTTNSGGIPFISVPGSQAKKLVKWVQYTAGSDGGASGYMIPMPEELKATWHMMEQDAPASTYVGGADRHAIIIDRDNRMLYEIYKCTWNIATAGVGLANAWAGSNGAVFDLKSNAWPRTNFAGQDDTNSSDAAGLAVYPGLVKYHEVYGPDEITHAIRIAAKHTYGHVYPASHTAGDQTYTSAPPLGCRIRLKSTYNISPSLDPGVQKIFRAMKTYGCIFADNGGNMFVTGTMDSRWNNGILNPAFKALYASDFEVIQLGWQESRIDGPRF